MSRLFKKYSLFLFIFFVAVILRVWQLDIRPMHGDEAVNAFKSAQLAENGSFQYDPLEYHGPALYYLTLPFTWLTGETDLQQLTETTLRMVPVFFCILLLSLVLIVREKLPATIFVMISVLTAISPAFVFYSRYYIHEMLLVFFFYLFILSFYYHFINPGWISSLLIGLSLGLMIATKETWIIMLFSFTVSVFVLFIFNSIPRAYQDSFRNKSRLFIIVLGTTGVVVLFYSSFFLYPEGVVDFISSFSIYFDRGINASVHDYPWYKYLQWILFYDSGDYISTEIFIFLLGLIGIYSVFKSVNKENIIFIGRIIGLTTVNITLLFSLIPYKTPWNMLTFWFGFIIMAGYGFDFVIKTLSGSFKKIIFYLLTGLAVIHLFWLTMRINFMDYDLAENPYTYSQPVREIKQLVGAIRQIENSDSTETIIQVIAKNSDYWPLPWYLRNVSNTGWYNEVDPAIKSAPVMVYNTSLEDEILYKLYQYPPPGERDMYIPLGGQYELRPGVFFNIIVKKSIWDKLPAVN